MKRPAMLALTIGTSLACGLAIAGWILVRHRWMGPSVALRYASGLRLEELRILALEDRPPPPGGLRASEKSTLRRFRIPEDIARELHTTTHPAFVFDALTGTARKANYEQFKQCAEHPRRGYTIRTNSLGLRRDGEIAVERPDLRVLVLGDSHVDGLCSNAEAFPAVLEVELERRYPGRSIEFLNAATGGYHPFQYLSAIEKWMPLQPHVVVLVWFAGNDFQGVIAWGHIFEGSRQGQLGPDDAAAREAGYEIDLGAMAQGFTSIHCFARVPDELPFCERISRALAHEAQLLCEAAGARLIVCLLPTG